jgi:TolA-binding protein
MKTLINAVEEWIDLRIFASSKNAIFEAKFNEMEKIHIRDANRIAELERRVNDVYEDNSFDNNEANIIDITERLEDLESLVEEAQGTADEAQYCANNVESALEDIESRFESVEGEVDIEEVARNVHDNVESFIIDAVREEIDNINFTVVVER